MIIRLIFLLFGLLILQSCNNGDHCYESTDSLMITNFIGSNKINIDSILIYGYNRDILKDTVISQKPATQNVRVGLPLSLSVDSTGFVVYTNGKKSNIWLSHKMNLQLISQSCGFSPYYKLNSIRYSSLIDSVKITDNEVDPKTAEKYANNGQNITVFLHLSNP